VTDDIVTRLRQIAYEVGDDYVPTLIDAADEIERLQTEASEWRSKVSELLDFISDMPSGEEALHAWDVDRRG
jgi:hypothetical protein